MLEQKKILRSRRNRANLLTYETKTTDKRQQNDWMGEKKLDGSVTNMMHLQMNSFYLFFFAGLSGDEFKFNSHGDGPARYNIIHYKQTKPGVYEWITVGYFHDDEIHLNMKGAQVFLEQTDTTVGRRGGLGMVRVVVHVLVISLVVVGTLD